MPGIIITTSGRNDGSFQRAVDKDLASAKAASLQMQNLARSNITAMEAKQAALYSAPIAVLKKKQAKLDPRSAEASAMAIQIAQLEQKSLAFSQNIEREKLKLRLMGSTQATAIERKRVSETAALEAERVAANQTAIEEIMAQEKAAGITYQTELQARLAAEDVLENERIAKAAEVAEARKAIDAETTAALIRDTSGALTWNQIAEEEKVAAAAKAASERVAIEKAAQLAMLETVATTGTAKSAFGHGGGGGITGIIREFTVIAREIAMQRGTGRIAGSVTLLAQYFGVLRLAVKSTAADSIEAAAAADKHAASLSREALMAEAAAAAARQKAGLSAVSTELQAAETEATNLNSIAQTRRAEATALANEATATETELATANAVALTAEADALRANALAQALRAKEMNLAKDIQVAGAVTRLNPLFFLAAGGLVAAGVAAFVAWRYFRGLAEGARNLANMLNPLNRSARDAAEALREIARTNTEFADSLHKINDEHESESKLLDEKLKKLREEATARRELMALRGATALQLNELDIEQLKAERKLLMQEQIRMEGEKQDAELAALAAKDSMIKESQAGGSADVLGTKRAADNAADVLQAAKDAAQNSTQGQVLESLKKENQNLPLQKVMDVDAARAYGLNLGGSVADAVALLQKNLQTTPQSSNLLGNQLKVGSSFINPISVAEATAKNDAAQAAYIKKQANADTLKSSYDDLMTRARELGSTIGETKDKIQDVNDQLGIKSGIGKQIAAESKGKGKSDEATALERVGFGAGGPTPLLSVAQQQLHETRRNTAATLETNRLLGRNPNSQMTKNGTEVINPDVLARFLGVMH